MSKKQGNDLESVLPEPVRIPVVGGKAEALVFPLGVRHLRKFNERISALIMHIARDVRFPKGSSNEVIGQLIVGEIAPMMTTDLFDLLTDCIRFNPNTLKLDDLPHWDLPPIVEAWIEESFGSEEKRDPWKRAVERTIARVTGKPFQISELLSQDSSPGDGLGTSSSTSDNPESPIGD